MVWFCNDFTILVITDPQMVLLIEVVQGDGYDDELCQGT